MFEGKTIMFIGSHPDDIELGCGALISGLNKKNIIWIVLSENQDNALNKSLLSEMKDSASRLKVKWNNVNVGKFKTREFSYSRQDICDYLYNANELYKPDIVFTHSSHDKHQDHIVVHNETNRAFKKQTILGYEIQASTNGFHPNVFIEVSKEELQKKINALDCYETNSSKSYFSTDAITSQVVRNGILIKKKYSEGFESYKIVVEKDAGGN